MRGPHGGAARRVGYRERPVSQAVRIDSADRLDAGTGKGLERAAFEDVGGCRIPGRDLLVGTRLAARGLDRWLTAIFLRPTGLSQNF